MNAFLRQFEQFEHGNLDEGVKKRDHFSKQKFKFFLFYIFNVHLFSVS